MLERFKSPVVIIQLISIFVGAVIFFFPGYSEEVQVITGAIVAAINVVAGLNNPTDPDNF